MAFDILVKKEATVNDTLQLIVNAVNVCSRSPFVRTVVSEISKEHNPHTDPRGFIRSLFDWCCRNGKYQLDVPGIEEVWTPELTTRMQRFDCKKISVVCASVLQAAGIEPILKHVYYQGPNGELENFTHIYTIVPASSIGSTGIDPYITVDPTNNCKFDTEVSYAQGDLYFLNNKKMELHMMGRAKPAEGDLVIPNKISVNTSSFTSQVNNAACKVENEMRAVCNMPANNLISRGDYSTGTVGASNQYFSYTTAEAVKHAAARINPLFIAMRNAFLGLLYLGKFLAKTPIKIHLAHRFAYVWNNNPNKIRKWWWLNGGTVDAEALQTALRKVVGGVIYGPYGSGADYPMLYRPGMSGTSIGEPVTLATAGAAIAAATPLIIAAKAFMKEIGVYKEGDQDAPPPAGTPEPTPPPTPGTTGGSFATHSIDTIHDLGNFLKASAVILLGASLNPAMVIPANIVIVSSFIYAIRKKIF